MDSVSIQRVHEGNPSGRSSRSLHFKIVAIEGRDGLFEALDLRVETRIVLLDGTELVWILSERSEFVAVKVKHCAHVETPARKTSRSPGAMTAAPVHNPIENAAAGFIFRAISCAATIVAVSSLSRKRNPDVTGQGLR